MRTDIQTEEQEHNIHSQPEKQSLFTLLRDGLLILIMGALLIYGASWQFFHLRSDAAKYECYATAFWRGLPALKSLPRDECLFITGLPPTTYAQQMRQLGLPGILIQIVEAQSPDQPLHALPHEYPLLTILPFSLGLLAPTAWSQVAFAIWMALIAGVVYYLLRRYRSTGAAIAFAFYIVVGNWGTAAGRFDLVPSALTLIALICAVRSRWNWAFALLALATLLKFYPLVLVMPFLLAQQMQNKEKWNAWKRWQPLMTFVGVCVAAMLLSFSLSIEGTLAAFQYFGSRPIQVESLSSSILWVGSFLGYPLNYAFTYGSVNVFGSLSSAVEALGSVLLIAGLGFTYWLQWHGKLDIAAASLLTLLIVMLTGKVFSPQYLIWVVPFAAYVGKSDWRWLVCWGSIGLLTTFIYPYIYAMTTVLAQVPLLPLFQPTVFVRNMLLLGLVLAVLYTATRLPVKPGLAASKRAS